MGDVLDYSIPQAKAFYEAVQREKVQDWQTICALISGTMRKG